MATEIVEYSKTEAALAELAQQYGGVVFDVTTTEGMATAKKGRAEIRKYRTSLEDLRKAIKAPALRRCQVIDEEARAITGKLLALEEPIDAQIKKEETRKEDEKNAAIRAEQARLAAEEQARKDAEAKRMADERAAIDAERKKLDDEKRVRDEQERQARLKLEADERAARQRIEEQERVAREAREKAEAEAKSVRDAEEARLRAEREKVERARREQEERERKEREAVEAKERAARMEQERVDREVREAAERVAAETKQAQEAAAREVRRKEIEQSDARAMLELFIERYAHLEQYKAVVKAITAALK